jgi:octaprenyl-diphosphate synthase
MGSLLGILFQRSDDLLDFDIRNGENKAVLGDLKSGYLNSFAVYLLKGVAPDKRSKAIKSESLGQLTNIIGQDHFNERVTSFDEMNEELIQFYDHQLSLVSNALNKDSKNLVEELRPLSELLYWRNQKH